jgi:hypothetical protein
MSTSSYAASTCLLVAAALPQLHRASGCLGSSCGSSSTTSPTSCVRVPRLVARPVVDCFAYTVRPGASARRAAHRRLLRSRRASGCLGSSRGSSSTTLFTLRVWVPRLVRGPSSTTSPTPRVRVPWLVARLVVDYFAHVARPGASARRVARRRLLRLRRASGCLSSSRGD